MGWKPDMSHVQPTGKRVAIVGAGPAGLACAGGVLTRMEPLIEEEIAAKLSRMGTIDLRVDYLRPGRGEHFVASASVLRSGNKVAVARVELHNHDGLHIATATATYLVG